jgi:hypothetical protein
VTVTHHRRKVSIGDKISGALLKIKGTITGRPGQKVHHSVCWDTEKALTNWRQRLLAREGCTGLMAVCPPVVVVSSKLAVQ